MNPNPVPTDDISCPVSMSVTWHKETSWMDLSSCLIRAGLGSLQVFPILTWHCASVLNSYLVISGASANL